MHVVTGVVEHPPTPRQDRGTKATQGTPGHTSPAREVLGQPQHTEGRAWCLRGGQYLPLPRAVAATGAPPAGANGKRKTCFERGQLDSPTVPVHSEHCPVKAPRSPGYEGESEASPVGARHQTSSPPRPRGPSHPSALPRRPDAHRCHAHSSVLKDSGGPDLAFGPQSAARPPSAWDAAGGRAQPRRGLGLRGALHSAMEAEGP